MSQVMPRPLEEYRDYLRVVVRLRTAAGSPGRVDESDAIQQTLLQAHARRDQFRGRSEPEFRGWLRRILANHLASRFRGGGDGAVRSLQAELDRSSAQLDAYLADSGASPAEQAEAAERLARLASALDALPDDQRRAIELHYLQGLSVPEAARRMERSTASVAGLVRRGSQALRVMMGGAD